MPIPTLKIMFGKKLFIDMNTSMHLYICEKLFTKNALFELGIGVANSFGMALNAFWKRALHIV